MAEPLKNFYSKTFIDNFFDSFSKIVKVDRKAFDKELYRNDWDDLELMQRTTRIMQSMAAFLPKDYPEAMKIVMSILENVEEKEEGRQEFWYIFFPEYIQTFGLEHWEISIQAIERLTQFVSCEFAIRPFIEKYTEPTMAKLLEWTEHDHENVRRLASEGCRPRLPWATALPEFKKDPQPIFPIIEALKADESLYVRKSVANNLNDISKDHPEILVAFVKEHINKNKHTDWILKHASRTLLKEGHSEIMNLFGYSDIKNLKVTLLSLQKEVEIGGDLHFKFSVENKTKKAQKVRLEYAIYYKRKKDFSKKVFKISEKELSANQKIQVDRKQRFKPINTRVFYSGIQKFSLIVNGVEFDVKPFELK